MLAASFGLVAEGTPHGGGLVVAGLLAGAAFIKLSQTYLEQYEVEGFEELKGAEARKVRLGLSEAGAVGHSGCVHTGPLLPGPRVPAPRQPSALQPSPSPKTHIATLSPVLLAMRPPPSAGHPFPGSHGSTRCRRGQRRGRVFQRCTRLGAGHERDTCHRAAQCARGAGGGDSDGGKGHAAGACAAVVHPHRTASGEASVAHAVECMRGQRWCGLQGAVGAEALLWRTCTRSHHHKCAGIGGCDCQPFGEAFTALPPLTMGFSAGSMDCGGRAAAACPLLCTDAAPPSTLSHATPRRWWLCLPIFLWRPSQPCCLWQWALQRAA